MFDGFLVALEAQKLSASQVISPSGEDIKLLTKSQLLVLLGALASLAELRFLRSGEPMINNGPTTRLQESRGP